MKGKGGGIRETEYRRQEPGAEADFGRSFGIWRRRYEVAQDYQLRALALGTDIDYALPRRVNRIGARPLPRLFAEGS